MRVKLMRQLHAEGLKRGLDHPALREEASAAFGVESLGDLSDAQLSNWCKKLRRKHPGIRSKGRRAAAGRAGRKNDKSNVVELAGGDELNLVAGYAAKLGWTRETLDTFIERQLGSRRPLRTMGDVNKVLWGMKRILGGRGNGTA